MGISYYGTLLPVREPGAGLASVVAGFRLPYRVLASICVPAGRIVVAFVSDSARLSGMFAANWAQAGTDAERTPRCMRWPGRPAATGLMGGGTGRDGGRGKTR